MSSQARRSGAAAALEEDCERPSCQTMKSLFKDALKANRSGGKVPATPVECPLRSEELGRSTWGFLHSAAAWYPEQPSDSEKQAARNLVSSIAALYPCSYCAADFRVDTAQSPPRVNSRTEFAAWLCEQHNKVNAKLGKPIFDCALNSLDKRWRIGPDECNGSGNGTAEGHQ
uniref:Sulfhydryl oxidase n=1 Tax=Rhizochromulina marina TaxID=1034831 RepID=A0A7S2SBP5_9STRA